MLDIPGRYKLVRRFHGWTVEMWKKEELVGADALNGRGWSEASKPSGSHSKRCEILRCRHEISLHLTLREKPATKSVY